MNAASALIKRNIKLFFKDKGMFFTSLITPAILLVLYVTFLGNVYRNSFVSALPTGFSLPEDLIDGLVGAQLISSILAVSCVTVSFCSNFLMVQDKVNGNSKDLKISPVKPAVLSMSYYTATLVSTLIISFIATAICLGYIAWVGWYMSVTDVLLLLLDIVLLVLFGTALSSIINFLRRRYDHQCGLRLYLRRVYARFLFWGRIAKGDLVFARDIRHIFGPQPFHARRACRNTKLRDSVTVHGVAQGFFGLQPVLF